METDDRIQDLILTDILEERKRQQELWGNDFDNKNTANDWASYICNYVMAGAYSGRQVQYTPQRFREHLVKAMTLCMSAIEAIDRNGNCAPRHYEDLPRSGAKDEVSEETKT